MATPHKLPYDQLILALGTETNFFNLPGVKERCLTVKTLGDGITVRNRLINHLEEANAKCAAGQRQPVLTFVVAGGGFAGVETLGGINDLVDEAIRFYPNQRPDYLRFLLITPDEVSCRSCIGTRHLCPAQDLDAGSGNHHRQKGKRFQRLRRRTD